MNWTNINIGAFLDDPTAERVRDAFEKVNDGNTYLFPLVNTGTKIKEVFRGFTSSVGTLQAQAAASINAGASFTIPENQLGVVTFVQFAQGNGSGDTPTTTDYGYTKFSFIIETGSGTYGSGGTSLTGGNLIELAPVTVDIDGDYIFALGNIGASTIQDFVNGSGPYTVVGLAVFTATQSGVDKIWLFTGGNGTFGTGATATTAGMFTDLAGQDPIPSPPVAFLPIKTITDNPHTVTPDDLNRPLVFTSNTQVVNVPTTLVESATEVGITLFNFKAHFTGTGTHTVDYPLSQTQDFAQGALIYALCIDITGDSVWVVKEIGKASGTGDMTKLVYDPNNVESDAFATDNMVQPTTAKTTPVDADTITLWDSAATFVAKIVTWANIKATLKTYFDTLYGTIAQAKYEALMFAVSDEETLLTTGTAKITFRMPYAMTVSEVRASVVTAPTGANLVIDINESGTTILSTKLSIDATEKTSTTATTPPVISDTALADDAEITINIDQIGSTIAGAGLKITLIGVRT